MDISQLAVRLVIVMLPGIIAALIIERLTVHKPWDSFRFVLYSFLLGTLSYLALQCVFSIVSCLFSIGIKVSFWDAIDGGAPLLNFREIFSAVVVSIFLGSIISTIITWKWFHRIAQKFGISEKYGDESLFYFFLNSPNVVWVRVVLLD